MSNKDSVPLFETIFKTVKSEDLWRYIEYLKRDIIINARSNFANYSEKFSEKDFAKLHSAFILNPPDTEFEESFTNTIGLKFNIKGKFSILIDYKDKNIDVTTNKNFQKQLNSAVQKFNEKFDRSFKLGEKEFSKSQIKTAKSALSNLIGGIGYFYGDEMIKDVIGSSSELKSQQSSGSQIDPRDAELEDEDSEIVQTEPEPQLPLKYVSKLSNPKDNKNTLLSATPSRNFFPRGFFWDEGFHQLLVGEFDNDLSLEIIESWFDTMDKDGWISREKIMGPEARSIVPSEFQVQNNNIANPPTLYIPIEKFADKLNKKLKKLQEIELSRLSGNYSQFFTSEPNLSEENLGLYLEQPIKYGLEWRGRAINHTLASGLDDYPRSKVPNKNELHLDLQSWMAYSSKTVSKLASILGKSEDELKFNEISEKITENIYSLFWNDEKNMFCDLSEDESGKSVHICHKGYLSLFPMIFGLLPADSVHYKSAIDLISSRSHLWTDYGLRSLSKKSEYYLAHENYWRGPIWININYLVLRSLYNNYKKSGFFYEQYDQSTGDGQRAHPFTGWSALVTLIMADIY
ncbi:putative mannosyl-oligosaccharide glucosidase [Smittium mucronatum]|uniref:mannosyl-oligosaccharide glucosidase n=1 Tax=Smittium mucronatum TaxID=133383 RepID=A0A1R0H7Z7_9FUNG|nr:putative mannosyl-oligosaccharide glucosidase [Smittium mucronatum]